jgi:uncharacterized protein (TIGR03437 family)
MARIMLVCLLLVFSAAGASAQGLVNCVLTSDTADVILNGFAEPVGDIYLRCGGAAPAQPLRGSLQFTVNTSLGNRLVNGGLPEITLAVEAGNTFVVSPYIPRGAGNSAVFENLDLNFDASGRIGLRFRGIRVHAQTQVSAWLQFSGSPQLLVTTPIAAIARPLLPPVSGFTTTAATAAVEIPVQNLDLNTLLDNDVPFLTTRVTEVNPATFSAKRGSADTGVRVIIRYQDAPADARIYVPHAVAGSSALQPTSAGDMGLDANAGRYADGTGTLLLIRAVGADSTGKGGGFPFIPVPGTNTLGGYQLADFENGKYYAVYEVWDSALTMVETAQIPAFVWRPPTSTGLAPIVHQTVSLAPISTVPGISESAPIPRYPATSLGPDCPLLGDCAAPYFPKMLVQARQPMTFVLNSGGTFHAAYVQINNTTQGFLEWQALVRYKQGSNWIRVETPAGVNNATIRFDIDPKNLPEGDYQAEIVIAQLYSPTGLATETTLPVSLKVLPPIVAPPPTPEPVVTDVFNAANRIIGPVAPGSLVAVTGSNFLDTSILTFNGLEAIRLDVKPGEITAVVPAVDPLVGRAAVVVRNKEKSSNSWGAEIAPVAPAVYAVLNENDVRNSESAPASTGSAIRIYVTGVANAALPLAVKLHDRVFDNVTFESTTTPGIERLSIVVPEDLPAMQTSVLVCANAREIAYQACAEPQWVWLKKP